MTYQERAKKCLEAFDGKYVYHDSDLTEESFVDGYIFGCVDQRKRDIEKACEWFDSHLMTFIEYNHLNGIDIDYSRFYKQFREDMEDKLKQ